MTSMPRICVKAKVFASDAQRKVLLNLMRENGAWFKYAVKVFTSLLGSKSFLRTVANKKVYPKRKRFCLHSRFINLALEDAEAQVSSNIRREWKLKGLLPLRLDRYCLRFRKKGEQWHVEIPVKPDRKAKPSWLSIPVSIQEEKYYSPLLAVLNKGETPPAKLLSRGRSLELHILVPMEVKEESGEKRAVCGIDLNMRKIPIVMLTEPDYSVQGRNIRFYNLKPLNQKLNEIGGEKGESQKLIRNEWGNLIRTIFKLTKGYAATYVIEDLTGIRRNSENMGRDVNRWLNSHWAYRQFREMLERKAQAKGQAVVAIPPKGTSSICYKCGVKGKREKWKFTCLNCGNIMNADLNAAINIAKRALIPLTFVGR